MSQPTMQKWTTAWHDADAEVFKNIYAKQGLIFPPNKPSVQGNQNILEFMSGGLGKVDVVFIPTEQIINGELSFEYGIFQDQEMTTNTIIGQGKYSVTWILEENEWKILCHIWSMPEKK